MKPHLVRWHETYGSKGLVVIDVNDGFSDPDIEDVRASVKKYGTPYPVLWDKDGEMNDHFGATGEGTPWTVLIGIDGEKKWQGHPLEKIKEIEALIERELEQLK